MPTRWSGSAFSTKRSHPPASNLPLALVLSPLCRRVCGYFESKFAHPQFRIELRLSGRRGRGKKNSRKNPELYSWSRALLSPSSFSILCLEPQRKSNHKGEKNAFPSADRFRTFHPFPRLFPSSIFRSSSLSPLFMTEFCLEAPSNGFVLYSSGLVFDRSNVTNPLRRREGGRRCTGYWGSCIILEIYRIRSRVDSNVWTHRLARNPTIHDSPYKLFTFSDNKRIPHSARLLPSGTNFANNRRDCEVCFVFFFTFPLFTLFLSVFLHRSHFSRDSYSSKRCPSLCFLFFIRGLSVKIREPKPNGAHTAG